MQNNILKQHDENKKQKTQDGHTGLTKYTYIMIKCSIKKRNVTK